jgi:hypothetical protein
VHLTGFNGLWHLTEFFLIRCGCRQYCRQNFYRLLGITRGVEFG